VGEGFFSALVQDLSEVLQADYAFVGELVDEGGSIQTLAVWADGALAGSIRYALQGTPCDNVVGRDVCIYSPDVARLFPDDEMLVEMGVSGYVGVPFFGADGSASGLLVAMFRGPVPDPGFASSVISLFAGRTGAEVDRVRAVRRTQELEKQVLQSQKLESLGVLAGGLAHDFNNVLSSILGSAELARAAVGTEPAVIPHLDTIRESSAVAAGLCRQLLAYAGKGRFQIEDAHISEVIRNQDRLLQASVGADVELELVLTEEPGAVARVDRGQVGQILLNLVINASEAIEHTGKKGRIQVSTGVVECSVTALRSAYLDQVLQPGRYVFIEVEDDGPGMEPEVLERLFDPFFTTKFTGRGLGLAAILGIVRSHNGTVRVYSKPGEGARFRVLLPVGTQAIPVATPAEPTPSWSGSGKILLVDDNASIRIVGSRMLQALGFEAITAEDGVQALELLEQSSGTVQLVILDLTMPRMGGIPAFRAIRRMHPEIPVVLTSGYSEQDTIEQLAGEELAGFLQKPFQLSELRMLLHQVLEESGD